MTAMIAGGSRLKTPARFKSMRETGGRGRLSEEMTCVTASRVKRTTDDTIERLAELLHA